MVIRKTMRPSRRLLKRDSVVKELPAFTDNLMQVKAMYRSAGVRLERVKRDVHITQHINILSI